MKRSPAAWIVRPFPDGIDTYGQFRERSLVAIGWAAVPDFFDLPRENAWDTIKARIIKTYGPQDSPQGLGQWAGIIHRFVLEMQPGDLVLVPHYGTVSMGVITGDYCVSRDDEMEHAVHRREVRWVYESVSRAVLSEQVTKALKGRQTVYRGWIDDEVVDGILVQKYRWQDEDASSQAITKLAQAVIRSIAAGRQMGINQVTLEKSILPRILGAGLQVLTTSTRNTPGDGDVDLMLTVLPELSVFIQVKYQDKVEAETLEWAKHQVREAIAYHKKEQQGEILGAVVIAGSLSEGLEGGWHHDDGKEQVLVLTLGDMDEWIIRWVQSMSAEELFTSFPSLKLDA